MVVEKEARGRRLMPSTLQLDPQVLWRILDVTRQLGAPIDLNQILQQVIDAARAVLQADRGTVFLYDAATDELVIKVATGINEIRMPATRGIAGSCAKSREVINVGDCYADARFNQDMDRKTGYRTRCLLAVPLIGHDDKLVGVMQVLNKRDGVFDEVDEKIATALAAQAAVALQRARLIEEALIKQKLEADIAIARDIQNAVLPEPGDIPKLTGYDIAGWNRPADQTGGDIFDAIPIGETGVMLMLADATGHGIGPALSVTQARSMVRMGVRCGASLDAIFTHLNDQLADDLSSNRFVTAFLGQLDGPTHAIRYHAGGQGPLLHFKASDQSCETIGASTFPLGIMGGNTFDPPPPIVLAPGDIFALISDGIFEYMDYEANQFGEERVIEVIRAHQHQPMQTLIRTLCDEVEKWAKGAPQKDDMTVLMVKRLA
jgi:phosphoserine phosphatase